MFGRVLPLVIGFVSILKLATTSSRQTEITDNHDNLTSQVNCQLTWPQNPEVRKLQLNAYKLLFTPQEQKISNSTITGQDSTSKLNCAFEKINYRESWQQLRQSTIEPSLPFTFFTNGFNHDGAINGSWMEGVSRVLLNYASNGPNSSNYQRSNIVFLPWKLADIPSPDGLLTLTLAYYKTMASYNVVTEEIALVLTRIVDFIEETQGGGVWNKIEDKNFNSTRAKHYAKFKFYANSLGAHLISNAIDLVHRSRPWVKFGTLVGLDPALPCFLYENHGLSATRLSDSVEQVQVIHSNAAFAGIYTDRGHINIVLNGGTFQPNCNWLDFPCSHARSNEIFTYWDDSCEMVAYRCSKYEQFKLGACETCDSVRNGSDQDPSWPKCVLVNLAEQHVSTGELSPPNDDGTQHRIRQLADNDHDGNITIGSNHISSAQVELKSKSAMNGFGYHFVNTNPNFKISNTHCLLHYQLRLLTLAEDSKYQAKCPISSYFLGDSKDIQARLMYEEMDDLLRYIITNQTKTTTTRVGLNGNGLTPIVDDKLYTGLVTFSGKAGLFVGAIIESIDFKKLSKCLIEEKVTSDIKFTLDIAFMSNTEASVRHAHSSILCGQWDPYGQYDEDLLLTLCKQSELTNISGQIDEILDQIKFQHQYDSWKISLLNSLFYLYSKWEPLR